MRNFMPVCVKSWQSNGYCLTLLPIIAMIFSSSCAAMSEGKPAPALDGQLMNGTPFHLSAEKGNVVIINLWASWCSSCRQEMPAIESYYQQHQKEGLKIIAISMDDPADDAEVRQVISKYSFQAALSREIDMKGYGEIWRMPMTFIVDREGILRKDGSVGEPKVDLPLLEQVVTPLLKKSATLSNQTNK
jgi:cytochrome c biogenesis protein CcmG/thiol:disulfide interchange protein DsbE